MEKFKTHNRQFSNTSITGLYARQIFGALVGCADHKLYQVFEREDGQFIVLISTYVLHRIEDGIIVSDEERNLLRISSLGSIDEVDQFIRSYSRHNNMSIWKLALSKYLEENLHG